MRIRGSYAAVALCAVAAIVMGVASVRSAGKEPAMVLRHVVLMKFKDESTVANVRSVETAFAALPSQLPDAIIDFEWGTDVSIENKAEGYTHCFQVTFASAAQRDNYIVAGAHKKFGELAGQHLDKVLVVDYWTKP